MAEGKRVKGKRVRSLERAKSKPKTVVVVPDAGIVPVPIRRATDPRSVVPRTTAQNMTRFIAIWPYNVTVVFDIVWFVLITVVPRVFTPFPHVATHIVQSPIIWLFLAYWMS